MNKLRISWIFMAGTVILIAAFQAYWLKKLYKEEYDALQRRTDILLKETVQQVQAERMKNIPFLVKPDNIDRVEIVTDASHGKTPGLSRKAIITTRVQAATPQVHYTGDSALKEKVVIVNGIRQHIPDSLRRLLGKPGVNIVINGRESDSGRSYVHSGGYEEMPPPPPFFRVAIANALDSLQRSVKKATKGHTKDTQSVQKIIYELRQLDDSIPLNRLDTLYTKALQKESILLVHHLHTATLPNRKAGMDSLPRTGKLNTRFAMSGFNSLFGYYAVFEQPFSHLGKKLLPPLGVSVLLIGVTTLSFVFMYRNLAAQRRLGEIKNEFISNITHELKTPVATVNVAIEALRNFNAIDDAARTKEYLDISAIELQRLNLLIDKVLRLSMFEKQTMDLQPEEVDVSVLVKEVVTGMRLQLEKVKAQIELHLPEEGLIVQADRLHFTSVVYNLLDNAVKYSPKQPLIEVDLRKEEGEMIFSVRDNGIGIPVAYQKRVFEKFFRVPDNNRHNIRGYGLGLSYVAHIVTLHHGNISVHSEEGKGSTFTIKLPLKNEQN